MPQNSWSAKRKRQYAHIKDSLLESGKPESLAQEIAARVVNKERAQHGESVTVSESLVNDTSAGQRGGMHFHQGSGVVGKVQEEAGKLVISAKQQAKGIKLQVEGTAQKHLGDAKEFVKETRHALKAVTRSHT